MKKISYNAQTKGITESTLSTSEEDAYKAEGVEQAKVLYKKKRKPLYPDIGDQLDDLYKQGAFSADMTAKIKKVKDDNPKP
tara:strand:+ start:538 stop:780 length:243 start_codon:yes stop_codon:yes gene_type:complete